MTSRAASAATVARRRAGGRSGGGSGAAAGAGAARGRFARAHRQGRRSDRDAVGAPGHLEPQGPVLARVVVELVELLSERSYRHSNDRVLRPVETGVAMEDVEGDVRFARGLASQVAFHQVRQQPPRHVGLAERRADRNELGAHGGLRRPVPSLLTPVTGDIDRSDRHLSTTETNLGSLLPACGRALVCVAADSGGRAGAEALRFRGVRNGGQPDVRPDGSRGAAGRDRRHHGSRSRPGRAGAVRARASHELATAVQVVVAGRRTSPGGIHDLPGRRG